jgi:Sec-independent protein translocase protein TatA
VARTVGRWSGQARGYINTIKSDVDKEMRLKELQDMLKQDDQSGIHQIFEETKKDLDNTKSSLVNSLNPDHVAQAEATSNKPVEFVDHDDAADQMDEDFVGKPTKSESQPVAPSNQADAIISASPDIEAEKVTQKS